MILDTALVQNRSRILNDMYQKHLLVLRNIVHRFIFDKDASAKVGRFAYENTDIICANAQFTMTPFPNTYIEVDNLASLDAYSALTADNAAPGLGFLFTEYGECFVCCGDTNVAVFTPFIYNHVNKFIVNNPTEHITEDSYKELKMNLMIGQVDNKLLPTKEAFTKPLLDLYEVSVTNTVFKSHSGIDILSVMYAESIGTFKRALAALMLLDAKIKPGIRTVAAGHKISKGKLHAIPAHSVVTIDLDAPAARKIYIKSINTHDAPYRHEVSGHWVHYNISTQCQHQWVPLHSEEAEKRDIDIHGHALTRMICSSCGGKRTRKLSFERGDPNKPKPERHYKVIASKEKET